MLSSLKDEVNHLVRLVDDKEAKPGSPVSVQTSCKQLQDTARLASEMLEMLAGAHAGQDDAAENDDDGNPIPWPKSLAGALTRMQR